LRKIDTIKAFAKEYLELDGLAVLTKDEAYEAYKEFCIKSLIQPTTRQSFVTLLPKIIPQVFPNRVIIRRRLTIECKQTYVWQGFKIKGIDGLTLSNF